VRQTEGADLPAACFAEEAEPCPIAPVCRLSGVLHEAVQAFYRVLDGYTLADLVRNKQALAKILFVPQAAVHG